jgi:sugar phosphate isomerase/epimerase
MARPNGRVAVVKPALPGVSIATSFDYGIPLEVQVPLIAEDGFTHLSLGRREDHSGYLSAAGRQRIKALLRANGLAMDTIHGPRLDQPDSVAVLSAVTRATAELGAPVVVVHASPFDLPAAEVPIRQAALLRTCAALEPVAGQAGIQYALENVLPGPATELVTRVLECLDPVAPSSNSRTRCGVP